MPKRFVQILTLLFSILGACTERIEIDLDEGYERLVVEGNVTTERKAHLVRLSRTAGYFSNQPAVMVSGAEVAISVNGNRHVLTEQKPGYYYTADFFRGIAGETYGLDIRLSEPVGGSAVYSASSYLNYVSPLDSIGLLFHPDWGDEGVWEVKCYVLDPPTEDFYRFLIYRNNVQLSDTLDEWLVTDDKFFNGNYIGGASIAFLDQGSDDEKLVPGDIVTAEINSIGKDFSEFIQQARSELFGSNPLFSGPPANVNGNISNGAFGFFAAYSITRAAVMVPQAR